MKKQQWAKATAVVLAASLLLPSVIPADTQAKAKIRLSAKKISLKVGQTKKLNIQKIILLPSPKKELSRPFAGEKQRLQQRQQERNWFVWSP